MSNTYIILNWLLFMDGLPIIKEIIREFKIGKILLKICYYLKSGNIFNPPFLD